MEPIVFIEFTEEGRPFTVITEDGAIFDFEWVAKYGCYYYNHSGTDPDVAIIDAYGPYWAAPGVEVSEKTETATRVADDYFDFSELFENASEGEVIYCSVCEEWMPEEEGYGHRHFWYDDDSCTWVGPGGELDDVIKAEIKQSFFVVLDKTRIARPLAFALARDEMGFDRFHFEGTTFGYHSVWCSLPDPDLPGVQYQSYGERFTAGLTNEQEAAMSAGVQWLLALDGTDTADANELTAEWIKQWEAGQKADNGLSVDTKVLA